MPAPTHATHFFLMSAVTVGFLFPACAGLRATGRGSPTDPGGAGPAAETPAASSSAWDPHAVVIVDGTTGSPASWDDFVDEAASADVVFFGEIHGHPRVQAVMAAMFADIVSRADGTPALSLEFFDRDEQVALADYLTSVSDEETFLKATHRTPKNYPRGHRAMVETAREHGVPVVASNAPRRYAKLARTEGYERLAALTAAQRRLFVIPEALTEGSYQERFFALMTSMGGHAGSQAGDPETMARSYFRAQNLWDATMADSIVRALRGGYAPVVHVVGKFHIEYQGGLVQRVEAAAPDTDILTVSFVEADTGGLREKDRGSARYVFYVGLSEETGARD